MINYKIGIGDIVIINNIRGEILNIGNVIELIHWNNRKKHHLKLSEINEITLLERGINRLRSMSIIKYKEKNWIIKKFNHEKRTVILCAYYMSVKESFVRNFNFDLQCTEAIEITVLEMMKKSEVLYVW